MFGAPPLADPKFGRVISFVPQELPGLTKDLLRCSLEGFEAEGPFTRWRENLEEACYLCGEGW